MRRVALIVPSIVALSIVASLSSLHAADKDKGRFAPGPASSFKNHSKSEGLTIAAEAYITDAQAASVFGKVRPHDYGVIPVLVVVQNDTDKAVRLDWKAQFVTSDNEHVDAFAPDDVIRFQAIRKTPGMPKPSPLPIPLPKGNKKGPLYSEEIVGKAFSVKLLPPGESAYGFLYFRAWDVQGATLYLDGIRNAATGKEFFYYEIPLD